MSQNFTRRPPSFLALALAATIAPIMARRSLALVSPPAGPVPRLQRGTRRRKWRLPRNPLNRRLARAKGPGSYDEWKLQLWAERRARRGEAA